MYFVHSKVAIFVYLENVLMFLSAIFLGNTLGTHRKIYL